MHLQIHCPTCDRQQLVTLKDVGNQLECPSCKCTFRIPSPGQSITEVLPPPVKNGVSENTQDAPCLAVKITSALFIGFAVLKGFIAVNADISEHHISRMANRTSSAPIGTLGSSLHMLQTNVASSIRTAKVIVAFEAIIFLITGIFLYGQTARPVCFFGSGLACLTIPIGTALGIASIVILRDQASRLQSPASSVDAS